MAFVTDGGLFFFVSTTRQHPPSAAERQGIEIERSELRNPQLDEAAQAEEMDPPPVTYPR